MSAVGRKNNEKMCFLRWNYYHNVMRRLVRFFSVTALLRLSQQKNVFLPDLYLQLSHDLQITDYLP